MSTTYLGFLRCRLVDLGQQALQLRPVAHQLVVHSVSLVQQGVDVSHRLTETQPATGMRRLVGTFPVLIIRKEIHP